LRGKTWQSTEWPLTSISLTSLLAIDVSVYQADPGEALSFVFYVIFLLCSLSFLSQSGHLNCNVIGRKPASAFP
jgi:hypothetical protein